MGVNTLAPATIEFETEDPSPNAQAVLSSHSPQAIRGQLNRILASKLFRSSELQKKFLTFVVLNTLEGRSGDIKEYSIGVDAFKRGPDFDPRIDSVVRVIARRVRDRLAEFYRQEGKGDPVVIKLSPGSYVPAFSRWEREPMLEPVSPSSPLSPFPNATDGLVGATDPRIQSISAVRDELLRIRQAGQAQARTQPKTRRSLTTLALAISAATATMLSYYLFFTPSPAVITKYTQLTRDGQDKVMPFSSGTHGEIVADTSRIYFSEISGTNIGISQVASTGGETVPVQMDSNGPLVVKDIAPDNSKLLLTDFYRPRPDLALQILPLPAGNPRPLGNLVGHDAAWSPDGNRIVYANGNDLYVANGSGTTSSKLVHCPGFPFWPRWSPDSGVIRFTVEDLDGATSLWEVSSGGTNLHRLTNTELNSHPRECCGSWSPNGRFFVFQSESNGTTSIWVIPAHDNLLGMSGAPIPLTNGPLSFSAPVFSKDGKQIFAVATQHHGELERYDASRDTFVPYLSGISADHIQFSNDKKWITYSSYPDSVIWRSRANGTDRLQLSPSGMSAWYPQWSPNGKLIAFMGSRIGRPLKIYVTSADGGEPEALVPGSGSEIDPNWSPNGESLMFGAVPSSTGLGPGRSEIEILDLRTRRISALPGSQGLGAPRWSPNGRFVVATALSQDKWANPAVLIFDFATGKWSRFEDDPIDNKTFSADGQYYYFDKYVNNDPAIFRIRLSDHKQERVAGLKDVRRAQGVMGWWMGLTPDNSPMVLRDTSIEEIYALDFKGR